MSSLSSQTKKWIRDALFALGVLISVAAWFVDRAASFRSILTLVAPNYVAVHDAFEVLDQGEKATLSLSHPGAAVLLRWWKPTPPQEVVSRVSAIGRSTGVFNIITGVHHYELRLLTQDNSMMLKDFIWADRPAKELMQQSLDRSLVGWSFAVLLLGLFLTVTMFVWERLEDSSGTSSKPDEKADQTVEPKPVGAPRDSGGLSDD